MNKRLFQLTATVLLVTVLGTGLVLTQQQAVAADTPTAAATDPMQFARGAQTWANTCSRCHGMRDPKELRDDQWRAAVAHMRVRAGLTAQEARDVLLFLQGSN